MKSKLSIRGKLQTFSGAMMVPVILLVLVGFYVGIGSAFTNYILPKGNILYTLFDMFSGMGFMFMSYLPLWFTIGISFTLAKKEKGWAAFSGIVMLFALQQCISTFAGSVGWNADTTTVEALVQGGYTQEAAMNFSALWTNFCGIFTFDMGIFSGLIAGASAAAIHNKWCEKQLPMMFSFFGGTKFVLIMVTLFAVPMGILMFYVWPVVAAGLQALTTLITSSGLFGTFLFGFADKALLPFGIHHLIAFPLEYTKVGGSMMIDGTLYEGVRNIILGQAGSAEATGYIVRNFTSGRILFQLAGMPAICLAMYKCAKPENRKKVLSIIVPAIVTVMLVGISEPVEYSFLFAAPLLYWLVYAPLCGLCYVIAEIAKISINGHALFFMIPNVFQPQKVHAMALIFLLPLTFALFYFIFKFLILKFNIKTPGRGGEDEEVRFNTKEEYRAVQAAGVGGSTGSATATITKEATLAQKIAQALGGGENVEEVSCCASRLRITVKDPALVAADSVWKNQLEAAGVVKDGRYFQFIYGTRVTMLVTQVRDILGKE